LLYERPYEEDEKTSYWLGKIFANHISEKTLVSRIYKELSKLSSK